MSAMKSALNISTTFKSIDIKRITPKLRAIFDKIMSDMQYQLFIDPNLTYEQQIELLNKSDAIEGAFLCNLYDSIKKLDLPEHIRDDLLENLEIIAEPMTIVDANSSSDSDTDDDTYSDMDTDDDDSYDDLENIILDQMEYEHDCAAFS